MNIKSVYNIRLSYAFIYEKYIKYIRKTFAQKFKQSINKSFTISPHNSPFISVSRSITDSSTNFTNGKRNRRKRKKEGRGRKKKRIHDENSGYCWLVGIVHTVT